MARSPARSCGHHGGVHGQGHGRQLRRRVGVGDAAADRPAGPYLAVPDERHGQAQQFAAVDAVALDAALGDGGADQPVRRPALHALQFLDGPDVDQHAGTGQPVVEHRDEALAPGQGSGLVAVLGQHRESLVEVSRPAVDERRRLHERSPAISRSHFRYSSRARSAPLTNISSGSVIGTWAGICDSTIGRSWSVTSCANAMNSSPWSSP